MQAVRTAAQKRLNDRLSTWMVTYVRSVFGLPFMAGFLAVVLAAEGGGVPHFSAHYLIYAFGAALVQVLATYFLILLFRMRNFAVGTILTKTDVMQAALIGSVLFSEAISAVGWLAIIVTVAGVVLISLGRLGDRIAGARMSDIFSATTGIGLFTGFLFCLSYLFLREASLSLEEGSFLFRGGWTVIVVTAMQVVFLGIFLAFRERAEFRKIPATLRACWFVGITSATGSICWFTAMTLQNASYVKAVGQVEIVFTILISAFYFRESINRAELAGIAVIVAGVLLFLI